MIVAMVRVVIGIPVDFSIIRNDTTALTTSDGLYIIKGKTTHVPITPQRKAFITSTYGLAGILNEQQALGSGQLL